MCKKKSLSIDGVKYQLVKWLADGRCKVSETLAPNYTVSPSILELRKLPIFQLKSFLNKNGHCSLGNKDNLILRVFLIKSNKERAPSFQERKDILKRIEIAEEVIIKQCKKRIV